MAQTSQLLTRLTSDVEQIHTCRHQPDPGSQFSVTLAVISVFCW